MALSIGFQPGKAIRRDAATHGMTFAQVVLTFNSTGTYSSGGLPITPGQVGFKGAIFGIISVSGVTSGGATQDVDVHWDFVNGKAKLFLMNGTEITTQFDNGGSVRAIFVGA